MRDPLRIEDLPARLSAALARPLPGIPAQDRMKPVNLDGTLIERPPLRADARDAAVLLLLYRRARHPDWHLALIKRPDYDGVHSGQIALPGGRREADETLIGTALREAREEIGIEPGAIEVIGQLTPFYVFASNHQVHPVVGFAQWEPCFVPCAVEVARVIEAPLAGLLDPASRREETRTLRWGPVRIPYFAVDGEKVWGATAMMLSEFLDLAGRL